jgi:NAD(P)-dependent dehydrogenase (short-subunit alcohol dehydrogenase family)
MDEPQKVALVTGAGRGIGRAIAIALAREGYALCLAARTFEELEETRRLTALEPERSLIVLIDLAAEESPETLVATALDHFGRLDVLVNNAGWAPARTALHKISGADQDRMLAVNLRAPIALTRLAAPPMIAQRSGAIVNIASAAGRTPPAFETVYAASKAGLIAFTHACFAELRERGIKVSVVIPGLVDTALIPRNKKLERARMIAADQVAAAVMQIVNSPPAVCPVEIVLEPQFDPLRTR